METEQVVIGLKTAALQVQLNEEIVDNMLDFNDCEFNLSKQKHKFDLFT